VISRRSAREGGPVRTADTLRHWSLAASVALAFNLILFGLLPGLIRSHRQGPDEIYTQRSVQVVRLPAKPPPRPAQIPKPPPPTATESRPAAAVPPRARPARIRPQMPAPRFQPQLPPLPDSLPPLALQTPAMHAPPQAPAPAPAPPTVERGEYGLDEIDGALVPVSQVPPVYPFRARRKGIEGWVRVQFVVTESGAVEQVRIEAAEPEGLFEKNVLQAVTGWRFRPGTVDGLPVRTRAVTTLEFKLE
jgi:protein TonB